jgi:predicted RNase H-like nuclease (RuvC/YqgF family)
MATETPKKQRSKSMSQKTVDAKTTKAPQPKTPTAQEVQDLEWMNWVEYAQSRIRHLENKVTGLQLTIEELKERNAQLNKRLLQG